MGVFDSLHNTFLNVLLGQGLVGFIIMMIFAVLCVFTVMKGFFGSGKETGDRSWNAKNAALLASIVSLTVSMLFVGDIFYLNSGASFWFWNILGGLVCCFAAEDKENQCQKSVL